jgi:hypothetical protein
MEADYPLAPAEPAPPHEEGIDSPDREADANLRPPVVEEEEEEASGE